MHAPRRDGIASVGRLESAMQIGAHKRVPIAADLQQTESNQMGRAVDGSTSLNLVDIDSPLPQVMRVVGIGAPLGSLLGIALVGVPDWYPHIVGLAAVTFIFVAVAELMPELHHGPHKPSVGVGLVLGVLIAYGMQWFTAS